MAYLKYGATGATLANGTWEDLTYNWVAGSQAGGESLTGTAGSDRLHGGGGAYDTLAGGAGDDIYQFGNPLDTYLEAAGAAGGYDKLHAWGDVSLEAYANIENLRIDRGGNNSRINGLGDSYDNVIETVGEVYVAGGSGNDVLLGSQGKQVFAFAKNAAGGGQDYDTVYGFTPGEDQLQIWGVTYDDIVAGASDVTLQDPATGEQVSGLQIQLDSDTRVFVEGLSVAALNPSLFGFLDVSRLGALSFEEEFSAPLSIYDRADNPNGAWTVDYEWEGHSEYDEANYTIPQNNEQQIYVSPYYKDQTGSSDPRYNPFSVDNGVLTITAKPTDSAISGDVWNKPYTSGVISTYHNHSAQTYGYFEIKADLPQSSGFWPAFWLVQTDSDWPPEIDVMEMFGEPGKENLISTTLHWSDDSGQHHEASHTPLVQQGGAGGMHTYGVLWTEQEITWYVDRVEVFSKPTPDQLKNDPMFMIANLAVAGNLPQAAAVGEYKIDYIKAWNLASDAPPPLSSVVSISGSPQIVEGDSGTSLGQFQVTRAGDLSGSMVVDYWLSGDAQGSDFASYPAGSVSFAPGETVKTIQVAVAGDVEAEPDESFTLNLSNARGGAIQTGSASGVILDDDAAGGGSATISISGAPQHVEGDSGSTIFSFTVNRTGDLSGVSQVDYWPSGQAQSEDFAVFPAGTVTFQTGEASKTLNVEVAGDTLSEQNESFAINLSNPRGAGLGTATATGVILDDDAVAATQPTVSISGGGARAEGQSGGTLFEFTLTRSGDLSGTTLVDYWPSGDAQSTDFVVFPAGTVTFQAQEQTKTIWVEVAGDTTPEPDESFAINLSNVRGGLIGTSHVDGLILDDDGWLAA